ncbi:CocE/NonD family hydrolase [Nocardia sp. NPDC051756]|uniref:CocE/NonD family hydrolase n=1 Tax=Nocardia sp. NPDC051756 TaxID=3154751 RepID=UPI0034355D20
MFAHDGCVCWSRIPAEVEYATMRSGTHAGVIKSRRVVDARSSRRRVAQVGSTAALVGLLVTSVLSGSSSGSPALPITDFALPDDVMAASAAPGHEWTPEPASFSVGKTLDVPVSMSDGTVLRADVYFPTDADGNQARGDFPVVLMQTPYGKSNLGLVNSLSGQAGLSTDTGVATPLGNSSNLALGTVGPNDYLVQRGYISVVADVRGTGHSQGTFGMFEPIQATDGVALVNWAATLPGANGKVGLYGASAMGIMQLITAGAAPKGSPLKAIFPVVPALDLYKDTVTMGGLLDLEFDAIFLGATGALNLEGPVLSALLDPSNLAADRDILLQHLASVQGFNIDFLRRALASDPELLFNDGYWQGRGPRKTLSNIVASEIPAYIVGSQYDLFQRGQPLLYSGLQNAYVGRPVDAPMESGQQVTGRYQLLMGPYAHAGTASLQDFDPLMLRWFDTWLKDKDTGMAETRTPLHYSDLGTGTYHQHAVYPFPEATPTRYYFNGGALTTTSAEPASDTLHWTPTSNPCASSTDQWSGGIPSWMTGYLASKVPCVNTELPTPAGPNHLVYTTAPLPRAQTLAGPITATVYAKATTTQTAWVARVDDIAPDGTVTALTQGALLGSLRAIDPETTWTSNEGQIFKAGHTYSRNTAAPVVPGESTRYDIDIYPTYTTIAPGHSIRVTLTTADTPHLLPPLGDVPKMQGGIYTVETGGTTGSSIQLPLTPAQ